MESSRRFRFGKYKGQYISDIIRCDTQYIGWCLRNVNFMKFTPNEMELYNHTLHDIIVTRSKMKNYKKKKRDENSKKVSEPNGSLGAEHTSVVQ